MSQKVFVVFCFVLIFISACSIEEEGFSYDRESYVYANVEKETMDVFVSPILLQTQIKTVNGKEISQKDYRIKNPSSGSLWDVSVYQNADETGKMPAVILVPGGIGSKNELLKPYGGEERISIVEKFASEGFVVLIFSAEGRGKSGGELNYNGYIDQDGLYTLYRFLASEKNVDTQKIGIVSYSYGVAMASGMLGRYQPEISYYIAWEGPVNRYYVSSGCSDKGSVEEGITCDDEAYWEEREALRFVPYFSVDTLMIVQTEEDHVQETNEHSLEFNTLAIEYLYRVRVNGDENALNTLYTLESLPILSEKENYHAVILQAMKEFT